jgi:hypothetical protein
LVRRRGVGATAASAVVFSILLVANLAVFVSSQRRSVLYGQADVENMLGGGAVVLEAAGGADVLIGVQRFLSAGRFECQTAYGVIANEVASLSIFQQGENLTGSAKAQLSRSGEVSDNMSLLSPFNGSVPGDLTLAVRYTAIGGLPTVGVSLNRTETHIVHLPLRLERAASDCLSAITTMTSYLANALPRNCTFMTVASLMDEASRTPATNARSDGFGFGLSYAIISQASCTVSFVVTYKQEAIQGIVGPFSTSFEEQAVVSSLQ